MPRDADSLSVLYRERRISFDDIWTVSRGMRKCLEKARLVAPHDMDVLILGEPGTGKNLLAQAIHNASPRCRGPFVALDVGAISRTLMAAELFGREKGAYSDAREARAGYFEQASGGTLFLDEIGNLAPECQQMLLTAVEAKQIRRLGGDKPIDCDVRLISATNADLKSDVEEGTFRLDLYHKIARLELRLPPLRERVDDIQMLVTRFIEHANIEFGREVKRLSDACLAHMLDYPWPGNVRELRAKIDAAMVLCTGDELQAGDVFPDLADDASHSTQAGDELKIETMERRHISKVLKLTGWNLTRAAELLGISRPTIYEKIKRFGLQPPSQSG